MYSLHNINLMQYSMMIQNNDSKNCVSCPVANYAINVTGLVIVHHFKYRSTLAV